MRAKQIIMTWKLTGVGAGLTVGEEDGDDDGSLVGDDDLIIIIITL